MEIEYLHHINYDDEGRTKGGFTVAYYVSKPDQVGLQVAVSYCRPDEMFKKELGRNVAQLLLTLGSPNFHRFYVRTLDLFPEALANAIPVKDIRKQALQNALLRFVVANEVTFRHSCKKPLYHPDGVRTRSSIVNEMFVRHPGSKEAVPAQKMPRVLQGKIDLHATLPTNLLSETFEDTYLAPERSIRQG